MPDLRPVWCRTLTLTRLRSQDWNHVLLVVADIAGLFHGLIPLEVAQTTRLSKRAGHSSPTGRTGAPQQGLILIGGKIARWQSAVLATPGSTCTWPALTSTTGHRHGLTGRSELLSGSFSTPI